MMLLQVASIRSLAPARYIAAMNDTVVEAGPMKLHWQSTKRGFSSEIGEHSGDNDRAALETAIGECAAVQTNCYSGKSLIFRNH